MRVTIGSRSGGQHHLLSVHPGEYDGFPSPGRLVADAAPQLCSADRTAVAAALLYGPWISGELVLERPVSPFVAEAIRRFLRQPELTVSPVELTPRALPSGSRTARITTNSWRNADHGDGALSFVSVGTNIGAGGLRAADMSLVVSNATLFESTRSSAVWYEPHVAVAVLFAEDLGAAYLVVEGVDNKVFSQRLRDLLASTRIGILGGDGP